MGVYNIFADVADDHHEAIAWYAAVPATSPYQSHAVLRAAWRAYDSGDREQATQLLNEVRLTEPGIAVSANRLRELLGQPQDAP